MNYKEKLYSKYVSTHTSYLGEITIENIKKQFPTWKFYYSKFLPKDKNAKILDVGCGKGGFVYWLQQISYENSFGIDISKEQIILAKRLGIKNIKQADLFKFLRDKKESYDVIFARDILEHFKKEEILNILKLFYNSLKQKGKVIIQVPNAEGPFGTHYLYSDFTHELAFTERSLNQIFKSVGFKEIYCYPTPPPNIGTISRCRFLLWKLIECLLKFYTLIETGSSKGFFTRNIICVAIKK